MTSDKRKAAKIIGTCRSTLIRLLKELKKAAGMLITPRTACAEERAPAVLSEYIHFEGDGVTLGGYLSKPAGEGPFPGVMVVHDIRGISDDLKDITNNLAQEGYATLSVNLVSRRLGPDFPGGSDEVVKVMFSLPDAEVMSDLDAGMDFLKKQPVVFTNSIGCMGICLGGRFSILYAGQRKDVKAAVIFYGDAVDPAATAQQPKAPIEFVPQLTTPLLGNYGEEDTVVPLANVKRFEAELQKYGKVYDFKIYPGAQHAFLKKGPKYHAEAAKDAWERALNWFAKYLRT